MGLMIGPAVPPVTFCLTWSELSYSRCHQSCRCRDFHVCCPAHEALQHPPWPCCAAAALSQPRTAVCALSSLVRSCRNKATRAGAVSGALSGISCGLTAWLVYAKVPHRLCAYACKSCRSPTHCPPTATGCAVPVPVPFSAAGSVQTVGGCCAGCLRRNHCGNHWREQPSAGWLHLLHRHLCHCLHCCEPWHPLAPL